MIKNIKVILEKFFYDIREYSSESNKTIYDYCHHASDFVDIFIKYNSELFQPKRKPSDDGTLPLTDSEKAEFADIIHIPAVYRVVCSREYVIYYISPYHVPVYVDNYKAIQYILEKFDLQNSNGDN